MLKPKLSTAMMVVGVAIGAMPTYHHFTLSADEAVSLFKGIQIAMSSVVSSIWLVGALIVSRMEKKGE